MALGLGAVLGSGLVGVVAAVILPELSAPIYCGSFCGMASTEVLPGIEAFDTEFSHSRNCNCAGLGKHVTVSGENLVPQQQQAAP